MAVREHGWTCPQLHGNAAVFLSKSLMSSLPTVETQKSRRNVSGVDRRETFTVWDLGLFDPARCAHLHGNELKIDCLSRLLISALMLLVDRLTRDHTEVFSLSYKCFVPEKCFSTASRRSASSATDLRRRLIWHHRRSITCGPSGLPLPCLLVWVGHQCGSSSGNVLSGSIFHHLELPHGVRLQRPGWWRRGDTTARPLTHE